jgi:hypothetical protein
MLKFLQGELDKVIWGVLFEMMLKMGMARKEFVEMVFKKLRG